MNEIYLQRLKAMGKTQVDVVRATGLSYALITGFFGGYRNLSLQSLAKVNAFLGISSSTGKPPKKLPSEWRTDYAAYQAEVKTAYGALLTDTAWNERWREHYGKYYPGSDFEKSREHMFDWWSSELGWENKKATKSKTINWRSTFTRAIASKMNVVYPPRYPKDEVWTPPPFVPTPEDGEGDNNDKPEEGWE